MGKSKADAVAILDRRIARLQEQRDRLESRPDDTHSTGAIVQFTKQFARHGQTYHYAVIKASTGKWYATGSTVPMTWDELLDLAESEGGTADGIWLVTKLEQTYLLD